MREQIWWQFLRKQSMYIYEIMKYEIRIECMIDGIMAMCVLKKKSPLTSALRPRRFMMASSNGHIFPVTVPLCGYHRSQVDSLHKEIIRRAFDVSSLSV